MATTDFYPEVDAGTNSGDAQVGRHGQDASFTSVRDGAGTDVSNTGSQLNFARIFSSTTSTQYEDIYRFITTFLTSIIGTDVVSSGTYSLWVTILGNGLSGEASANSRMQLVPSTPADNSNMVAADYSQLDTTDYGKSVTQENLTIGAYEVITILQAGLDAVNGAGVTPLGVRYVWDVDDTTTGITWSSAGLQRVVGFTADQATTATDPKLTLTYAPAAGGIVVLRRRIEGS